MVSTVGTRPNHYELLGLEPTASADEIRQAFARAMRSPRPMAEVAQVGIANAVLRDPVRRREYDRALGLGAPEKAKPAPWGSAVTPPRWTPFMVATAANSAGQASAGKASAPEPHVTPLPQPNPSPEPIEAAAIPRERKVMRRIEPQAAAEAEPRFGLRDSLSVGYARGRRRSASDALVDWKYPIYGLTVMILTAAVLGAWAGSAAGSDAEAAAPAVTVALPKAGQALAAPAPAAPEAMATESFAPRTRRPASRPRMIAAAGAPQVQVAENDSGAETSDPLAPAPEAASMPLPNRVIARTIERIGYACGAVASTTAVEGASGVFKVSCTSGQTYQAAPVRGRYRFRRMG